MIDTTCFPPNLSAQIGSARRPEAYKQLLDITTGLSVRAPV